MLNLTIGTPTMTKNPPLDLRLRHATSADREPIVAWCHTLWDGERDYIEDTWDDWQAEGNLYVGNVSNYDFPVVLIRMRYLSPTEAWFGGLRIHPSLHGHGIGKFMIAQAEHWARERGCTTLGYMTETRNHTMHYLADKLNFAGTGAIYWHDVELDPHPTGVHHDASMIELTQSAQLHAQHGRYFSGWAIQRLTAERLAHHAAQHELFVLDDQSAWAIVEHQWDDLYHLSFADGEPMALQRLVAHIRSIPQVGVLDVPLWQHTPQADMADLLNLIPTKEKYDLFEKGI